MPLRTSQDLTVRIPVFHALSDAERDPFELTLETPLPHACSSGVTTMFDLSCPPKRGAYKMQKVFYEVLSM